MFKKIFYFMFILGASIYSHSEAEDQQSTEDPCVAIVEKFEEKKDEAWMHNYDFIKHYITFAHTFGPIPGVTDDFFQAKALRDAYELEDENPECFE